MEKLYVGLGKNSYDILIGENFFERFPEYIGEVYKGKKLFVITDSNVDRIYKNEYERMFKGFEYNVSVLQAGEKNKHIGIMPGIYSEMVNSGLTRKDMVVAFGGGVVGDIAGFAAASYMRGIGFIQIPTTIVSQVDSSVGGKVGVDLPEGKNLVGAFHQPKLVLIDNYFLNTLTDRYFYDGFAEIVKYGCIYDKKFFDRLVEIVETVEVFYDDENYKQKLREHLMKYVNEIVYRSCEIKKEKKDEFLKIEKLLKALNLPTEIEYPKDRISEIMKRDKKSTSDGISFVILKEIGEVEIRKIGEKEIFE